MSRTEDEKIAEVNVERVVFTRAGEWMATFEHRNDHETTVDVRLKFWQYSSSQGRYVLNTSVEPAHSQRITSLTAHPTENLIVSTGADKVFKGWVLRPDTGIDGKGSWQCAYIRSYHDLPCYCSGMALDGSLLAVGAGYYATLWNPKTCELAQSLASPGREPVRALAFTKSAHLVTHSKDYVTVWNLLNCTVWWRIKMDVLQMCADPFSPRFALVLRGEVFHWEGKKQQHEVLLEFDPASATPLYQKKLRKYQKISAMTYIAKADRAERSALMLLDEKLDVSILGDPAEYADDATASAPVSPPPSFLFVRAHAPFAFSFLCGPGRCRPK